MGIGLASELSHAKYLPLIIDIFITAVNPITLYLWTLNTVNRAIQALRD
jgi:hypothetical protein